jgi:hypothetical protein
MDRSWASLGGKQITLRGSTGGLCLAGNKGTLHPAAACVILGEAFGEGRAEPKATWQHWVLVRPPVYTWRPVRHCPGLRTPSVGQFTSLLGPAVPQLVSQVLGLQC